MRLVLHNGSGWTSFEMNAGWKRSLHMDFWIRTLLGIRGLMDKGPSFLSKSISLEDGLSFPPSPLKPSSYLLARYQDIVSCFEELHPTGTTSWTTAIRASQEYQFRNEPKHLHEVDFSFRISRDQVIVWSLSNGSGVYSSQTMEDKTQTKDSSRNLA
ncbi:hypothetical protein AJ79_01538 [Helicocarpus griseus UAMH5409]|uniref:Uncharacterized protein n=1 Tax=Helicocarpus griseus UAMH5409 TaxID=1447875 RepID=A0A2B7Y5B8_9EURO|nr:hypothetical protein AJ79_01538 [Helicocarpus griseus UAMH5409]